MKCKNPNSDFKKRQETGKGKRNDNSKKRQATQREKN